MHRLAITAVMSAVFCISMVAADIAAAKPKKPSTVNGCTIEQIQAPSAGPCISQLEQDTINNVAYPHALFCDETGVYCCQSDGTRTFGCKKVGMRVQPGLLSPIAPGTLQNAPQ